MPLAAVLISVTSIKEEVLAPFIETAPALVVVQ